jgi:hypothetical protein
MQQHAGVLGLGEHALPALQALDHGVGHPAPAVRLEQRDERLVGQQEQAELLQQDVLVLEGPAGEGGMPRGGQVAGRWLSNMAATPHR